MGMSKFQFQTTRRLQPGSGTRQFCNQLRTKREHMELVTCANEGMDFNLGVIFKIRNTSEKYFQNV